MNFKNKFTGEHKQVKFGFSWTYFFFGVFVPLFRKDWKNFGLILLVDIVLMFTYFPGAAIVQIIISVFYNQWYIKDLIKKGYYPADEFSIYKLKAKKIQFETPEV